MLGVDRVLSKALALSSTEKLQLIDNILASFYPINKGVDNEWKNEAEERISSYGQGSIPVLDESDVLSKYKK